MLVDSHCHLNFPELKSDLDGVIARAKNAGVEVMQTICTEMAEFEEIYGITQRYEGVYCSVGVHPNDSGKAKLADVGELVEKTRLDRVIGIGETGLDYHYEHTDRLFQQQSFRAHIEAARVSGLPLIVHSRDADEDTVNILHEEYQKGKFKGLIHCFTSTEYLAKKSLEIGFYISFSGIVSFKNAESIRSTLKVIPKDKILIETDAPYLAPVPYRGKTNEPAFVKYTNKSVAETLGLPEEEVANFTTTNFFRLFDKAVKPAGI